ncbi:MAG: cation:proton antiporter [Deltaproteobacteria bacterium]|jgi:Kef-type K+ transport system membrane component KefB|nr:cation:proton antiporter [Deltaproteobacteria bacterium]
MHADLLTGISIAICAATALALVAKKLNQPLLLAYLAAGICIGPAMGFGLIEDQSAIHAVSEIGLILLLYIIGLEIDIRKLIAAGKTLVTLGTLQFLLSLPLGIGFFLLLGFPLGGGRFDALYLSVALAISSTMIVVKLLYDKGEFPTLPGRLTLGVLVFQDLWAILFLSMQPNLLDPRLSVILLSLVKGVALVAVGMLCARYVLARLFTAIARVPELLLVTAIAWCFFLSGIAGFTGLSREMGALVAGICLSTFPYNVDVIAKVTNIRDFFVTLFFIGLGMQIPMPSFSLLALAVAGVAFIAATRLITITPVLYALRNGLRTSLLPAINLAQMSEFSLVIASIGLSLGHIDQGVIGLLAVIFALGSVASTYAIQYNNHIQNRIAHKLRSLGVRDLGSDEEERDHGGHKGEIAFLGFFRESSAIFHELEHMPGPDGSPLSARVHVVDFSPIVYAELTRRKVPCTYGDIASMDTLHHAGLHAERVVACTIPDAILRGIDNRRLLQSLRRLCRTAFILVTADTLPAARELYDEGADFVFVPRIHSARDVADVIAAAFAGEAGSLKEEQTAMLAKRDEVLA